MGDQDGDVLDSTIAALVTFSAIRNPKELFPEGDGNYSIEGYIYT